MGKGEYKIRRMKRKDLDVAIDWAAREGWNPGFNDADCFYKTDPRGFFIGTIDGEPISSLSVVKYGRSFAFIGFYIVKPEYRGKGYGLKIWRRGMKYLGQCSAALDGIKEQLGLYRKSGFKMAYWNITFKAECAPRQFESQGVVNLKQFPFKRVVEYDEGLFPVPRAKFLKCWIRHAKRTALGLVGGDRLAGYGVIRECRQGYKIGPLFANDKLMAEKLFWALVNKVGKKILVQVDVPELNGASVALMAKLGLKEEFRLGNMYRGKEFKVGLGRVFGLTTYELG